MQRIALLLAMTAGVVACTLTPEQEDELGAVIAAEQADVAAAEAVAGTEALEALEALLGAETVDDIEAARVALEEGATAFAALQAELLDAEAAVAEKERELVALQSGDMIAVASTFWPQLAAAGPIVAGLAGLLSKRWRKHAANALKSVLPVDGKVDLGGGLLSLAKAYGLAHTNESPEEIVSVAEKLLKQRGPMTQAEAQALLAQITELRTQAAKAPVIVPGGGAAA